jgi:hypothetical protein
MFKIILISVMAFSLAPAANAGHPVSADDGPADAQLTSYMDCLNTIRKASGAKPKPAQKKDYELLKAIIDECAVLNAFVPQTGGYKDTKTVSAIWGRRTSGACRQAFANAAKSVTAAQNKACQLGYTLTAIPKPPTQEARNRDTWKELLWWEKKPEVSNNSGQKENANPKLRGLTRIIEDNRQKVERVCQGQSGITSQQCTDALKTAVEYVQRFVMGESKSRTYQP